jgi:AcrR family transcriptional regulator
MRMKEKTGDNKSEKILKTAVRLFSEKGFHGTSMRDIAADAQCSLPMLYYYYKDKEELFYEIAYNEFVALIERLNKEVKRGATIEETYFEAIKQRKKLSDYDKAVYKLAQKAWLGFEGDSKVRNDLSEWERGRLERTKKIFASKHAECEALSVFSNVMVRVMENMIEKIIFFDEDIPDKEILDEIKFISEAYKTK